MFEFDYHLRYRGLSGQFNKRIIHLLYADGQVKSVDSLNKLNCEMNLGYVERLEVITNAKSTTKHSTTGTGCRNAQKNIANRNSCEVSINRCKLKISQKTGTHYYIPNLHC